MKELFVYVTAPSGEEAKRIGREVVAERLAACANIVEGMTSIFQWHGKTYEDPEAILILKTMEDRLEALVARIRSLHSYECPCIVALPIAGGNRTYLEWVATETRPEKSVV